MRIENGVIVEIGTGLDVRGADRIDANGCNAVVADGLQIHVGTVAQPQGLLAPVRVEVLTPTAD